MRNLIKLIVVLFLSGCSSTTWTRPGTEAGQFKRDQYECSRDSQTLAGGSGLIGAILVFSAQQQAQEMYDRCMISKGYAKK